MHIGTVILVIIARSSYDIKSFFNQVFYGLLNSAVYYFNGKSVSMVDKHLYKGNLSTVGFYIQALHHVMFLLHASSGLYYMVLLKYFIELFSVLLSSHFR